MTALVLDKKVEREEAQAVVNAVASDHEIIVEVQTRAGANNAITLTPELSRTVFRVLATLASGGTVSISDVPKVLSTTEAARILGISRPTLMKRVRSGEIPSFKVGSHTRLNFDDVVTFQGDRENARKTALDRLRNLEFELDDQVRKNRES